MLGIVQPFALLADIVAVFLMTSTGDFNVCAEKALLERGKKNSIRGVDIQVGMGCTLCAHLVAHTPVLNTGEAGQRGLDDIVRISVCSRIIKGQLVLSCLISLGSHPFNDYTNHAVAKG